MVIKLLKNGSEKLKTIISEIAGVVKPFGLRLSYGMSLLSLAPYDRLSHTEWTNRSDNDQNS